MNRGDASFLVGLLLALAFEMSLAGPPILVDRQTGKYLGNLSNNPHDPNSTSNPYGGTAANTPPIPSTTRTASTVRAIPTTPPTIPTRLTLPQ